MSGDDASTSQPIIEGADDEIFYMSDSLLRAIGTGSINLTERLILAGIDQHCRVPVPILGDVLEYELA